MTLELVKKQVERMVSSELLGTFQFLKDDLNWPDSCIVFVSHSASPKSKALLEAICGSVVETLKPPATDAPTVVCCDGYSLTIDDLQTLPVAVANGTGLVMFISDGSISESFDGNGVEMLVAKLKQDLDGECKTSP